MSARLHADAPLPPGVRAFTTLRYGAGASQAPFDTFNLGNRHAADGDDPAVVEANRRELVDRFALPSAPVWMRQVHGIDVMRLDEAVVDAYESEADAAVTTTPGRVVAILTADCLPVLFFADDGREVGGAHAGWRGLAAGVLEATVDAMRTPAADLHAWLGPAAGPQNYEVGVEVFDAFVAPDWTCGSAFACTRPDHWRVDLYALARRRLERAGLRADRIHGGGLCTIGEPDRFYSHRRDRRTGRMASVIWFE
ncbi:peptidoglycan editing factor PgeF [Lysobacter humi (ex Lee et al. 2017)]